MKSYTVAKLQAAKSFSEIEGETKIGSTDSVKYKEVALARSESHAEAVVVSYNGSWPFTVISNPAEREQFLYRGC